MYTTVALFALVVISTLSEARINPCGMPIDGGLCLAYFPSWGYDKKSGKCIEFVYGGCGGNLNRFESKEECESACAQNNPCSLPIARGNCFAYMPSWGYDKESGRCVQFVYGGCGGNANRFETREACEMVCGK
nr:Papilin [Hymenolepis microstoma]